MVGFVNLFSISKFSPCVRSKLAQLEILRGGPQVEPKPKSSGKNLLILWNTTLPIAAQLMSRHCSLFQVYFRFSGYFRLPDMIETYPKPQFELFPITYKRVWVSSLIWITEKKVVILNNYQFLHFKITNFYILKMSSQKFLR